MISLTLSFDGGSKWGPGISLLISLSHRNNSLLEEVYKFIHYLKEHTIN